MCTTPTADNENSLKINELSFFEVGCGSGVIAGLW